MSKTVNKAIDVLETFLTSDRPLNLTEISRKAGINTATGYRLLQTLMERGLVVNGEKSAYRLGLRFMDFSYTIRRSFKFTDIAHGPLSRLSEEKNADLFVGILDKDSLVIIEEYGNTQAMRINSPVGTRQPLHCTACGKILLTSKTEEQINELLSKPLRRHTLNSVTDPVKLKAQLATVAIEQVAYAFEEYKPGINGAAVPVHDTQGKIIAAIATTGTIDFLTKERMAWFVKDMTACAEEISRVISKFGIT